MNERVLFQIGKQREFLKEVLVKVNCPSLRAFTQFGFDVPYSTLKNYFIEVRLLPKDFFLSLCSFAKIDSKKLEVKFLGENWGQVKGGKSK
jgi:hypothetical protein